MTPEGIFMSITGLAPRPIEETPKDFRFLSIRASHFWIGVGELRRGRRPDLARDPHTECADGQDRRQRRLHGRVLLRIDRRQLRRRGFDGRRPALRQPGRGGELRGRACPCGRHQHDGLRASYAAAMDATGKHTGVPAVGHVNADDVVVYDVLPHLGDRGVGPAASNARGSQWQPRLAGPVAVADSDVPRDKVKIQYSTSENACRGEATAQGAARAAGPAGCVDDWTDSPASFGDVRAVRAEFANRATRSGPMTRRPACGPSSPTDRPRVRCPLEPLRPSSSA